jgi:transketolase
MVDDVISDNLGTSPEDTGNARMLSIRNLERMARRLRGYVIKMVTEAGSGHPGGSLSAADLVTALFFHQMRYRPDEPAWPDRDRFVLSKGHAAPVLYAAMAEAGYFPTSLLTTLRKLGSPLQGHPSHRDLPAVEASTGSLGQGLSIGNGMALAARLDKRGYRVYVLVGDGESEEGQVWEAAMSAAHYRLDNLTLIVDHNGFQLDGTLRDIMNPTPLASKWQAFGWKVAEINGHDMSQILAALSEASATKGQPTAIIAHTVKCKGVSFMENDNEFHGKAPTREQAERALVELAMEVE